MSGTLFPGISVPPSVRLVDAHEQHLIAWLRGLADTGEDATAVVQAAFDAGITRFPPGTYSITEPIRG